MCMVNDGESYTESLINWGESGSFFPNAIPDGESIAKLRPLQFQIIRDQPNAQMVNDLHMTFFHCKPKFLRDYLLNNVNPDLRQEMLYMDLANNFGTIALTFDEVRLPVDEIEKFGDDDSIAVIKLGRTAAFSFWLEQMKDLFIMTLQRHGASKNDIDVMRKMPEFQWSLGESESHVSLVYGLGRAALPSVELPYSINFNKLSAGSVQVQNKDPLRWYVMPDSIDF